MVKLFYVIVGVKGSAFSVDIDASQSVWDLKKAIKEENKNIRGPAHNLQLFLAKGTDGAWLKDDDLAAQQLYKGERHPHIQQVIRGEQGIATRTLQRWLFVDNNMLQPSPEQIHVLVVVPEEFTPLGNERKRKRMGEDFADSCEAANSITCQSNCSFCEFESALIISVVNDGPNVSRLG